MYLSNIFLCVRITRELYPEQLKYEKIGMCSGNLFYLFEYLPYFFCVESSVLTHTNKMYCDVTSEAVTKQLFTTQDVIA